MRRIFVAVGVIAALTGALVLWPLGRVLTTHERGQARVLAVYRDRLPGDRELLRVVWEAKVAPGQWLLADRQADQVFRTTGDPELTREEAAATAMRIMPDSQGRPTVVPAFWKANDPIGTAFIMDVTSTHWMRRYLAGMAAVLGGLLMVRIALRSKRRIA